MNLAPIVLFVYNRPWHTRQTIEALQKNYLASESDLFIYSDGFKSEIDKPKVLEVREYIKNIDGFKSVSIKESPVNKGLADSIIDGVTDIVNKYGRIIVLEDDLITSACFLEFMNDALDLYENEKNVGMIHGHIYDINNLPDNFFLYKSGCLGWGTWKRTWSKISFDGKHLLEQLMVNNLLRAFDCNDTYPFTKMLKGQISNNNQSWAVRFYAFCLINQLLTFYPGKSLVQHIGIDGGTHCKGRTKPAKIDGVLYHKKISVEKIQIKQNDLAYKKLQIFFKSISQKSWKRRIFKSIMNLFPKYIMRFLEFLIFKKKLFKYRKLRKFPRFTQIEVCLFKHKLKIIDAASFLFQYKEIFILNIYNFISDKDLPYIIDAGANIGLSVIYFKRVYPDSKIIAFEPDPSIFNVLEENIKEFSFNNVELINKAVWNKKTVLKFETEGADGGKIADIGNNLLEIEAVSLREYIKNNKVDLLKIDIEGAETVVLEDIADLLKNVNRLFVEYHSFVGREQTLEIILRIIKDSGFRYYINHPGLTSPSKSPFMNISTYNGIDMGLNIYAFRD